MGLGNYGIVRPADVDINDISIYYNFTSSYDVENNEFFTLDASQLLTECNLPTTEEISGYTDSLLEGMYNLKLPATIFNEIGIYTIYIKPKMISLNIVDCGVLSAFPTIKGILINASDLDENLRTNNALQGYRIEYINSDGTKLRNIVRYVVTSNRVVPVVENVSNGTQKSTRYRFDDNGSLLFLQITPSSSSSLKSNSSPFIGYASQKILMSNTYFTPLTIEVNMVKNNIDTIYDAITGEQIRDVKNGIVTLLDGDGAIKEQYNVYVVKNDVDNSTLYEIKEKRDNYDSSQTIDNIVSDI